MKAWVVSQLGEVDDVLELKEVPNPSIEKGEVLIKVKAFALNFFDILQCQGKYQEKPPLPFIPGAEVAGVIEEVAEGSRFQKGQRVLAKTTPPKGGYAEMVAVPEGDVLPISDEMSFDDGAALYITYHTSHYALKNRAQLQAGETLLVHAGSGGVGSAAIQIGKSLGARVIATAGSDEKVDICKKLGADVVINYQKEDFVQVVKEATNGKGADVIYDPVGGEVFQKSRKCIAFDGRILIIGFAGGVIPEAPLNHVLIKNYSLVGVHWGYYRNLFPEKVNQAHEEIMELYRKGAVDPLIYHAYKMEEVPKALNDLASRKTWGKLIVHP